MKSRLEYLQDWIAKAESDFKIARREMAHEDPASDAVCFHFQQCAEKMLKAYLIGMEASFRPTHNIAALLKLCEDLDPEFATLRHAEILTPYAVEIRFADDLYFPNEEETQEALECALAVRAMVLEKLRPSDSHVH